MAAIIAHHVGQLNKDTWTVSKRDKLKDWSEILLTTKEQDRQKRSINFDTNNKGWIYETGKRDVPYGSPSVILEGEEYEKVFYNQLGESGEVTIYTAYREVRRDDEQEPSSVPFVVAISPKVPGADRKAVVYSPEGRYKLLVPFFSVNPSQFVCQRLWESVPKGVATAPESFKKESLKQYEECIVSDLLKRRIGILYVKPGQEKDELQILGNLHSEASTEYLQFLDFIGERVDLSNLYNRFNGGLPAQGHSYYTKHRNVEVMFHVATMLPFIKEDVNMIEKKKFLANNLLNILFVEPGCNVDVSSLSLGYTHVFLVVEPLRSSKDVKYKIGVAVKEGVPPFGPFIGNPPVFNPDSETREWILTKILNAERAVIRCPSFQQKIMTSHTHLIIQLFEPPQQVRTVSPASSTLQSPSSSGGGEPGSSNRNGLNRQTSRLLTNSNSLSGSDRRMDRLEKAATIVDSTKDKGMLHAIAKKEKKLLGKAEKIRIIVNGEGIQEDITTIDKASSLQDIYSDITTFLVATGMGFREVDHLKLKTLVIQQKHVEALKDLDIITVVLKQ